MKYITTPSNFLNEGFIAITLLGLAILPVVLVYARELFLKNYKIKTIRKLLKNNNHSKKDSKKIEDELKMLTIQFFEIRLKVQKELQELEQNAAGDKITKNQKLANLKKSILKVDAAHYANMHTFVEGTLKFSEMLDILEKKYDLKQYKSYIDQRFDDLETEMGEIYISYAREYRKLHSKLTKYEDTFHKKSESNYFKRFSKLPIEELITTEFLSKLVKEIVDKIRKYNIAINPDVFQMHH